MSRLFAESRGLQTAGGCYTAKPELTKLPQMPLEKKTLVPLVARTRQGAQAQRRTELRPLFSHQLHPRYTARSLSLGFPTFEVLFPGLREAAILKCLSHRALPIKSSQHKLAIGQMTPH